MLHRRQVLLRAAALIGVTAAASACQHTAGRRVTDAADEYDSMQITPPAPATPGGGQIGGAR